MLDHNLIEQLRPVLEKIDNEVVFKVDASPHADQGQLLEMLQGLANLSSKIRIDKGAQTSQIPRFEIWSKDRFSGISFRGIPGGHEFSSLILAILNLDGKGKLPDEGIQNRVRALKGPVKLSTYVSLTCENCPDVVQALNLMATIHPDFEHEMVDGAYVPEEVEGLGLKGVPALIHKGKLLHSGKIQFADLLTKLEGALGVLEDRVTPKDLGLFDVAVVGGGPAGASAAIYSARKGLKTAIIADRVGGQVQDTKGIENLISVPYTEGPQLSVQLAQHVEKYPIKLFEHRRVKTITRDAVKRIELESGEFLEARIVIITTGAKWKELGVPGEKEYLGRGVAFCPHCDGPFYQGKKVAVIGGGNSGVEAAIDLSGIVKEVVLLEFAPALKADNILVEKLKSLPNVKIITNAKTTRILGDSSKVNALEFQDRATQEIKSESLDGVFVQIGLLPNSQFLKGVVDMTPFGEIIVDAKGRTSATGIYAAGDVTTTPYKQIVIAMGEGAKAALAAFEDRMLA